MKNKCGREQLYKSERLCTGADYKHNFHFLSIVSPQSFLQRSIVYVITILNLLKFLPFRFNFVTADIVWIIQCKSHSLGDGDKGQRRDNIQPVTSHGRWRWTRALDWEF